jgi:hypothetical protein
MGPWLVLVLTVGMAIAGFELEAQGDNGHRDGQHDQGDRDAEADYKRWRLPPKVGGDGSYAWEATSNYGFQKLKFKGKISKQGTATGNAVIEYRPMISGVSPVTGLPRVEFDYRFVGQDYTPKRK